MSRYTWRNVKHTRNKIKSHNIKDESMRKVEVASHVIEFIEISKGG